MKKPLMYSMYGLKALFKERAFKQELLLSPVVFLSMYFSANKLHIFSAYMLVLITEALNTGIEKTVDRISAEYNELSKIAKDTASAAVFISIIHLAIVVIASVIPGCSVCYIKGLVTRL